MKFTCPHCHKTSEIKTRSWPVSDKVNEARRRNGQLGGHPKAPKDVLAEIYQKLFAAQDIKPWTWRDYRAAVKKKTGFDYSPAQVFAILKKLRCTAKPEKIPLETIADRVPDADRHSVTFRSFGSDEAGVPDAPAPTRAKKATHKN